MRSTILETISGSVVAEPPAPTVVDVARLKAVMGALMIARAWNIFIYEDGANSFHASSAYDISSVAEYKRDDQTNSYYLTGSDYAGFPKWLEARIVV